MSQSRKTRERGPERPRVLVLEALAGGADCVQAAGGAPLDVRPTDIEHAEAMIEEGDWHGLLLTGGGDVDPRMYGQRPKPEVYGGSETRDLIETYALEMARDKGVPVLGICRGSQLINVEAGGALQQHIDGHRGVDHDVRAKKGSVLRRAAGSSPRVVSLHHQQISRVARGYVVSGRAPDGTVEAIESRNGRVLGVQFHPEMDPYETYAQGIFRWLVLESARRAGMPDPPLGTLRRKSVAPSRYQSVRRKRASRPVRAPRPTFGPGVRVSWICPHCGIRFDKEQDKIDHVEILHGPDAQLRRARFIERATKGYGR